ncbi:hypothetical protein GCM10028822_28670 [Hymenobacter terrigena]
MKVFVVSLTRADKRREYINAHLSSLGLDYEIIDAVDYLELTPADYETLTDQEAVRRNPYLSKGSIACSLSHIKIYKRMVQDSIDVSLVLEDDAQLPKNIKQLLSAVEANIQQNEVISLSYFNHFDSKPVTHLSQEGRTPLRGIGELVYPIDLHDIASTMAYVITKNVAEKMIDILMPISVQTDYWGVYYEKGAFDSFRCLYPVPVRAALLRSSIDYEAGKTLTSRLAAVVRKYKIPVLLGYLNRRANKMQEQKYYFDFVETKPFNHQASF